MNNSERILRALQTAGSSLDNDALTDVTNFISTNLHQEGGFTDRSGTPDPYYSMFGYSLCLALNIKIDVDIQLEFIESYCKASELDFIHAVSVIRCHMLLEAIKEQQRLGAISRLLGSSQLLMNLWRKKLGNTLQKKQPHCFEVIDKHRSDDGGYNHDTARSSVSTSYATFIIWSLFSDLAIHDNRSKQLEQALTHLKCPDGSYSNIATSQTGIVTATSAAAIVLSETGQQVDAATTNWLLARQTSHGGLTAAAEIPLPDMLSTATGLLCLACTDSWNDKLARICLEYVDLHWDKSGGFFGSALDQTPDIEYTYYALLTLGLCA